MNINVIRGDNFCNSCGVDLTNTCFDASLYRDDGMHFAEIEAEEEIQMAFKARVDCVRDELFGEEEYSEALKMKWRNNISDFLLTIRLNIIWTLGHVR